MKEDFEKWALSKELDITHYNFNPKFKDIYDYNDIMTQQFFECWKAAITTESVHARDATKWCNNQDVVDGIIDCDYLGVEDSCTRP